MLPVVDISNLELRKKDVVEQLACAAREQGCFQVVNHGLPLEVINTMFKYSQALFALPTEAKRCLVATSHGLGWREERHTCDARRGNLDMVERWQCGWTTRSEVVYPTEDECPGLKQFTRAFMIHSQRLSCELLALLASGLQLLETFFDEYHNTSESDCQQHLRLNHWVSTSASACTGSDAGEPYLDPGTLTLLFLRPGDLLYEVEPVPDNGHGVPLAPVEGAIIVLVGKLLARWSDDEFKRGSLKLIPASVGGGYCMSYLNQANSSALIQGARRRYLPISAYQLSCQEASCTRQSLLDVAPPASNLRADPCFQTAAMG